MRTRRKTQLEIMKFYQREVNMEAERKQKKENKKVIPLNQLMILLIDNLLSLTV